MANVVGSRNIHQRLARLSTPVCFSLLMLGQLQSPTKHYTSRFRTRSPVAGSASDQFALKLRQTDLTDFLNQRGGVTRPGFFGLSLVREYLGIARPHSISRHSANPIRDLN